MEFHFGRLLDHVHAAYLLDPDGNYVEAVYHGPLEKIRGFGRRHAGVMIVRSPVRSSLLQVLVFVPRRRLPTGRADRSGFGARSSVDRADGPRRRLRNRGSARRGEGSRRQADRRLRSLDRRRLDDRAPCDQSQRLREPLPIDHRRPPPLGKGNERRRVARGVRARPGSHRVVGRGAQPVGPRARSVLRRSGIEGRVRRPSLRDGGAAPPSRRAAGRAAPQAARGEAGDPDRRGARSPLSHEGAAAASGRLHRAASQGEARRRRPAA